MKSLEKIEIEIPKSLYDELQKLNIDIKKEVTDALFKKVRYTFKKNELKVGYLKMGDINLGFAKMCLEADEDALKVTEQYLTECE